MPDPGRWATGSWTVNDGRPRIPGPLRPASAAPATSSEHDPRRGMLKVTSASVLTQVKIGSEGAVFSARGEG